MGNLDQDPIEWMNELFQDEYCAECGGDTEHHDAVPFMDNWFARCKATFYAAGSQTPAVPATHWVRIGDQWTAVVLVPIDEVPTTGGLIYRNARGVEVKEEM